MEIRASYVLVGVVVLAILVGIAAFSVWLVKADGDRQVALYEIAFAGSVSGLQKDGQVRYRGIPVGRVANIRIDPELRKLAKKLAAEDQRSLSNWITWLIQREIKKPASRC